MNIEAWWRRAPGETYWLEITDRSDVGMDLKAPQRQDNGSEFWGYSLLTHVKNGDVVFHYDRRRQLIASWSRISGGYWDDEIVWGAHGTSAREGRVAPYSRPGWKVGLVDYAPLGRPVSLAEIRARRNDVLGIERNLQLLYGDRLYLAYSRYGDSLRPQQGYLAKLPEELVRMFPPLNEAAQLAADTMELDQPVSKVARARRAVGTVYRPADEAVSVSERDPMVPDPALIERGNRGHATAQNSLASSLAGFAMIPLSPKPGEPPYDLAWSVGATLWVAEVKSLTKANEERQLRLGLGQVLRYADLLSDARRKARPVLMVERRPSDSTWEGLCKRVGVVLLWPDRLEDLSSL